MSERQPVLPVRSACPRSCKQAQQIVVPAYKISGRLIGLEVRAVVLTLWPTFRNALVMLGVVLCVRFFLNRLGVEGPAVTLAAMVATGVTVFAALLLLSKPPFLSDILNVLHLGRLPW